MAKLNLFEGSRRLALVLKVAYIGVVALVAYSSPSSASYINFSSASPLNPLHLDSDNCQIGTDGVEFERKDIGNPETAFTEMCFKAMTFEADGRRLVPYKIDEKNDVG